MSKRLPYFQFEPAEWLAGDIMFCSLNSQGLYVNIMALYWQKDCELTLEQAKKRLQNEDSFNELISEKIIKIESGKIRISFLDNQYLLLNKASKSNSENGKKGAEKRWKNKKENSESIAPLIATPLKTDGESIALREDKIKEDNIIPSTIVEGEKENFDDSDDLDSKIKAAFLESQKTKEKKVAPKKESNQDFANSLKFESQEWLDNICIQQKKPPDKIIEKLDEFVCFLKTQEKEHPSRKEFISHFTNWVTKKFQENGSKQSFTGNTGTKKAYEFSVDRVIETYSGQTE